MENILRVLHVITFVFMSVPLFNLIVVNERARMGSAFNYATDRYMENIIGHSAIRCFVFQFTALTTGILLLVYGPLGISGLWQNPIVLLKTLLLFILMGLLSFVHFRLQPRIEAILQTVSVQQPAEENLMAQLKPHRMLRKKLATTCLFLVLTSIILGLQVYGVYPLSLTLALIGLAALFTWRANKTLIRFGWL